MKRPRTLAAAALPRSIVPRFQQTLANTATVEGFGFWSGRDVRVEFRPAPPDSGIAFVRHDLTPAVRIPALVEYRSEMPRRTALVHRGARVEMVEHVLAALAGMKIDNCEVWVNEPEMPGCDGSSLAFATAIESAGVVTQKSVRPTLVVRESVRLGDDESWIEAGPPTKTGLHVQFRIEYPKHPAIGRQTLRLEITQETFRRDLAPCRTFLLREEAEWLRAQGLAQRATSRDALVFDADGPVDNETRFDDECVRHKVLDLVGDLALAGCDIHAQIVAHKSGHRLNAELARALLIEAEKIQPWRRCA